MRIELFLIVLAFSIFDFLYFQSYFNSTTNGKEVYNFRAFLGAIVILFSAIYIVLPTIAIAFVSFLISGKPEFPQVTWSLSSTTTFLSLLIADASGYLVIGYLLSYILIDQFKGVDNLSYEFNLSTFVEKKVDETFEAISENLDRELEKSKEMEERIKELEERIKELEKERQQLIASIRTEYERGFFDASKKMNDEFNRNKKIIEKNAKDEILNLLFEFDYAPRDGQSKKTFFTRIRNGLTKIYHPDHNIGADTNRIMQIINEHYEKLTK
ncbi:MAG: hypothetical protein RE469_01140 [Cuniculiplasma divulgatum]|nr:MAG: hypothetical protein RE469_01140 [Cuniculiplasma divulgatum]